MSRNALSLTGVGAIEREAGGQRPAKLTQPRQCFLTASIPAYFELAISGDPDLDLIALLQLERVDDG